MTELTAKLDEGYEIDIKRFYLNASFQCPCPTCGEIGTSSFNENYLSHPTIGAKDTTTVFCDKCDDYFIVPIVLRSVTAVI